MDMYNYGYAEGMTWDLRGEFDSIEQAVESVERGGFPEGPDYDRGIADALRWRQKHADPERWWEPAASDENTGLCCNFHFDGGDPDLDCATTPPLYRCVNDRYGPGPYTKASFDQMCRDDFGEALDLIEDANGNWYEAAGSAEDPGLVLVPVRQLASFRGYLLVIDRATGEAEQMPIVGNEHSWTTICRRIARCEGDVSVAGMRRVHRRLLAGHTLTTAGFLYRHLAGEPNASRCDRCGEVVTYLDAGFTPDVQEMAHNCGGRWRPHYCEEVSHG